MCLPSSEVHLIDVQNTCTDGILSTANPTNRRAEVRLTHAPRMYQSDKHNPVVQAKVFNNDFSTVES